MADQALSGVKVIDLSQEVTGPYCAKLLADYGAEVIKVEPPDGGDPGRRMGPFVGDVPHYEKSLPFLHLNTNKLGITLNLKTETGKKLFKALVKDADILVESFPPRVMRELGLTYETLKEINPKLVMTSITDYGQWGPYADMDFKATAITRQAWTGPMIYSGDAGREPIVYPCRAVDYLLGVAASIPTLACLRLAQTDGVGNHVDFSCMEWLANSIDRRAVSVQAYAYSGGHYYTRNIIRRADVLPKACYPCKDGYFTGTLSQRWFDRISRWIGRPELITDPRFATQALRETRDNRAILESILLPWFLEHTQQEIMDTAEEHQLPVLPCYTTATAVQNPQYQARGYFVEIEHPVAGEFRYPGAPFKMSESPWQAGRAPLLGEHNVEVYCGRLGYSKEDLVRLRERGII